MNEYENVVIFDPAIGDEQIEKEIEMVQGIIQNGNGEVLSIDKWGTRKFAYPIKKKEIGFYCLVVFKGNKNMLQDMEKKFKLDEKILRYSIVRT